MRKVCLKMNFTAIVMYPYNGKIEQKYLNQYFNKIVIQEEQNSSNNKSHIKIN